VGWPELVIAQVVKQYTRRAVSGMHHCLSQSTVRHYLTLLWSTLGCQVLNTAFIERLAATFRSRLEPFWRRTRCLARRTQTVERSLYLVGTLYNFCCVHASLTLDGQRRTPTMAAGITDHCWTVTSSCGVVSHHPPGSHRANVAVAHVS
jgi:hypothetical protein